MPKSCTDVFKCLVFFDLQSPKPQDIRYTIIHDEEKHLILTSGKRKLISAWQMTKMIYQLLKQSLINLIN